MKTIKSVIFISGSAKEKSEFPDKYRGKANYYWIWNKSRDIFDYLIDEEIPAIKMTVAANFYMVIKLIWAERVIKISGHSNNVQSMLKALKSASF